MAEKNLWDNSKVQSKRMFMEMKDICDKWKNPLGDAHKYMRIKR